MEIMLIEKEMMMIALHPTICSHNSLYLVYLVGW